MQLRAEMMIDDRILNETMPMTQDTTTTASERRNSQRFKISAPLTVIAGEREIPAYTRDLSNRGVFFYLSLQDSTLIDRDFEFLIEMPSEITLTTSCKIRCRGKLLRKEVTSKNLTGAGIAAEILDYSILRDAMASA
jgi:PilZ domain